MLAPCFLVTILNFTPILTVALPSTVCRQCYQHKCDKNNICSNGCIPGFAGSKCLNECPPNCIGSLCDYDGTTGAYPCSVGCNPGYHGLQCNTPCGGIEKGRKCDRFNGKTPDCGGRGYGENCETSCEPNCGGLMCDNKGKCIKEVCIPGRYGADCGENCPAGCERCHKDTGTCLQANADKDLWNNRGGSCDNLGTEKDKDVTGYFIAIICMFVFIFCSWIFYFCEKYFWSTIRKSFGEYQKESNVKKEESKSISIYAGNDHQEEGLDGDSASLLRSYEGTRIIAAGNDHQEEGLDGDSAIQSLSRSFEGTQIIAVRADQQDKSSDDSACMSWPLENRKLNRRYPEYGIRRYEICDN